MKMRYYIDPDTGAPHILNHEISEDEAKDVLNCPGEDRPGREGSRTAIGQTRSGRNVRVIYVPDPAAFTVLNGKGKLAPASCVLLTDVACETRTNNVTPLRKIMIHWSGRLV